MRWYLSLNHDGAMAVDSGGDSVCVVHGEVDERGERLEEEEL